MSNNLNNHKENPSSKILEEGTEGEAGLSNEARSEEGVDQSLQEEKQIDVKETVGSPEVSYTTKEDGQKEQVKAKKVKAAEKVGLSVGKKLIFGFVILILIMATITSVAINRMQVMDNKTAAITNEWLPSTENINELSYLVEHIRAQSMRHVIVANTINHNRIEEERVDLLTRLDQAYASMKIELYSEEIQQKILELKTHLDAFIEKDAEIIQLSRANNTFGANYAIDEAQRSYVIIHATLEELIDINAEQSTLAAEEAEQAYAQARVVMIILIAAGTIIGVVLAIAMVNSISKPLRRVTETITEVAKGNLALEEVQVKSKDEIGQLADALNKMVHNLRELIHQVGDTSNQVAATSEELTASAEQSSEASTHISRAIEEVANATEIQENSSVESARSMEEMSKGIQRIAESSNAVSEASLQTANEAQQGNEDLQKVMAQMDAIKGSAGSTAAVIEKLGQRSKEIGEIIHVITDISAQTNLLALNAAIEAARAGEHGRGFAVVADEVRALADQSNQSAEKISNLIKEIQQDTNSAVESMKIGSQEVEAGTLIVQETGESFQRILSSADHVVDQVQEISAVAEQMSASSQQVTASVEEMANLSKQSSSHSQNVAASAEEQLASMQEITSTATSLSDMAEELQDLIKRFKV